MAKSDKSSMSLVSAVAKKEKDIESISKSCRICAMPLESRSVIEEMMARGMSDNSIIITAASLEDGLELSPAQIQKHIDHLPVRLYTFREITERRAKESGISPDSDQNKMTPMGFLEMLITDSADTLSKNPNTVPYNVGVRAAKVMSDVTKDNQDNADVMQWVLSFRALMQAVSEVCSREEVHQIVERANLEDVVGGDGS